MDYIFALYYSDIHVHYISQNNRKFNIFPILRHLFYYFIYITVIENDSLADIGFTK